MIGESLGDDIDCGNFFDDLPDIGDLHDVVLNKNPSAFPPICSSSTPAESTRYEEHIGDLEGACSNISSCSSDLWRSEEEEANSIGWRGAGRNRGRARTNWRRRKVWSEKIERWFGRDEKDGSSWKCCLHCEVTKTPQWRAGPLGPKTLCNACGVRYQSGRLLPEYRPAASPTFVPSLHSNSHKKVLQIRSTKQPTPTPTPTSH